MHGSGVPVGYLDVRCACANYQFTEGIDSRKKGRPPLDKEEGLGKVATDWVKQRS